MACNLDEFEFEFQNSPDMKLGSSERFYKTYPILLQQLFFLHKGKPYNKEGIYSLLEDVEDQDLKNFLTEMMTTCVKYEKYELAHVYKKLVTKLK